MGFRVGIRQWIAQQNIEIETGLIVMDEGLSIIPIRICSQSVIITQYTFQSDLLCVHDTMCMDKRWLECLLRIRILFFVIVYFAYAMLSIRRSNHAGLSMIYLCLCLLCLFLFIEIVNLCGRWCDAWDTVHNYKEVITFTSHTS